MSLMTRSQQIIRDLSIYSFASMLTQFMALAAGIVSRHFLGPAQMGIWSLLQIFSAYAGYVPLGVPEAILREIPYHEAKGEKNYAQKIKDLIFSFTMLMSRLR